MAITTTAPRLGTAAFSETGPVELRPNWTEKDAQSVIRAAYRQVFGNDHLMQAERLIELESLLINGKITVRQFIRALAKSKLYKEKFFYPNFQTRVIELNFKHLLGRAPYDESEVIEHVDRYQNEGYEADIDSYIDSEEYSEKFGESIVPYYVDLVTTGKRQRTVGFTHMFQLYRGYANSDRSQAARGVSRLAADLAKNGASAIIAPSGPSAPVITFGGAPVGATTASQLGYEPFVKMAPIELRSDWTEGDVQAVIYAVYRQVLGNEHVMQNERLTSAESLLRQGNISVREFVRAVAQSELYRKKFFYSTSQVRFIELNYKHLLGRAPYDESEITAHVNLYTRQGYEAEIDSYINSQEYQRNFGDAIVPYYQGFESRPGQKTVGFSHIFQLYRGYASSDRGQGKRAAGNLTRDLALDSASPVKSSSFSQSLAGAIGGGRGQLYRVRIMQAAKGRSPQVRRSMSEYVVAYDQLTPTLKRLNQRGCRVMNISPA